MNHRPARKGAEVKVVTEAYEQNAERLELCQGVDQVTERSAEAVQLPHQDYVKTPLVRIRHQAVEFRAAIFRARNSGIDVLTEDLPAAMFAVLPEFTGLQSWVLTVVQS